ncbi:polymorphic toxin type 4 domain-containing protein [Roseomonas sp. BN140053]|uniref:polymorphic toxin type 4 domain-containing protein n=1 Tax=Roseomonas sp. BN140053 TaxID=3391898 RepID=UPI0039EA4BC2
MSHTAAPSPTPGVVFHDPLRMLNHFERRTAGTGGIRRIAKGWAPDGRFGVIIEGTLLPPLYREDGPVPPGRIRASNFNKLILAKQGAGHLRAQYPSIDRYQMSHLWGPGFGDEAAAGMMWAPIAMNLEFQNMGIERFIRERFVDSRSSGAQLRLRATAVAWDDPPNVTDFLRHAEYELTSTTPGGDYEKVRITIEVLPPGNPGVKSFHVEQIA